MFTQPPAPQTPPMAANVPLCLPRVRGQTLGTKLVQAPSSPQTFETSVSWGTWRNGAHGFGKQGPAEPALTQFQQYLLQNAGSQHCETALFSHRHPGLGSESCPCTSCHPGLGMLNGRPKISLLKDKGILRLCREAHETLLMQDPQQGQEAGRWHCHPRVPATPRTAAHLDSSPLNTPSN